MDPNAPQPPPVAKRMSAMFVTAIIVLLLGAVVLVYLIQS